MLGSRPSSSSSTSSASSSSSIAKSGLASVTHTSNKGSILLQPLSDSASPAPSTDFTTTILRRLTQAEESEKLLRRQLSEVIMKNNRLQTENEDLRSVAVSDSEAGLMQEVSLLRLENEQLHQQIHEMEQFLRDYGLEWVGYAGDGNEKDSDERNASVAEKEDHHVHSYHHFVAKVEELNTLIKSEPVQIQTDRGSRRGKFVYASEVSENFTIGFYKNGILVRRGPFRAVGTPGYIHFCRDIMDGYFPSELRNDYPDGVLFTVVDHRSEYYSKEGSGGRKEEVMSASELTSRLKDHVIRNGEIHSVKSEITSLLGVGGHGHGIKGTNRAHRGVTIYLQTSSYLKSQESSQAQAGAMAMGEECTQPRVYATVQVKWIDGRILIAVMQREDTIAALKEEIITHMNNEEYEDEIGICPVFELRSAYPPRALGDELSLVQAGLVPNGTVHARKL